MYYLPIELMLSYFEGREGGRRGKIKWTGD